MLALTCLVTLSNPPSVYARGADEYILPTDCVAEQEAYSAVQTNITVKETLETPWTYKYSSLGATNGPDDFRHFAGINDDQAAIDSLPGHRYGAQSRLRACAYRAAATRMEANLRRVTAGLPVKSLVSQGDCQAEQSAYVAAYTNDRDNKFRASRVGHGLDGEARAAAAGLVGGVQYNYYLGLRGKRLDRQNFLNLALSSTDSVATYVRFDNQADAARARLGACLYSLAADRVGADSGDLPRAQSVARAEPEVVTCAADRLTDMNREIADVDSRLDAFLTSDYANATGLKNATPMLTVTIWGLKGQIDAIRKYCPDVELHQRRIEDLESSLKHTQDACDQIQAGGAKCVATEPKQVM